MKQKSIKILLMLLILIPFKVKASTLDIKLSCPKTAYQEETINCQITYTNELLLNAIIVKYNLPQEIEYQTLLPNTNWIIYYKSKKGFVLGSTSNNNTVIATLSLKISNNAQVNKEYQIELTDIDVSDTEFNSLSLDNAKTIIKIISKETTTDINNNQTDTNNNQIYPNTNQENNNTNTELKLNNDSKLKSLILSYGTINFKPYIFEYKITVPNNVTTINIDAIPNSAKSTITIDKPTKLIVGTNKITITVEAEDKTTSKYIIIINREKELTNNDIIEDNGNSISPKINNLIYIIIIILIIIITMIINKILKRKK